MHVWDDWTDCWDPCFRKRRVVKKDIVIQCIDGFCFPVVIHDFRKRDLVKSFKCDCRCKPIKRRPVIKKPCCDHWPSDHDVW